jgi:succinyl-diaminopimelate desuccinylase
LFYEKYEDMLEEIISLSKILIAVPTVTGDEKALELAVEIVYQDLYDYNVRRYHSNGISSLLYYNTEKFPEKFGILLNTNLDVVPGKESQFTPYEKDGKLYGRGAWDMKTATAAMILVFKELAKQVDYPLGLQLVSDQEVGGKNGTKYQLEQGVRTDFALVSSPTNLDLIYESKGQIWLKIKATGKQAATAHLWKGENALWKMKHFLDILEQKYPEQKTEGWQTSVNLAKISTPNETFNLVPEQSEILLEVRPIPEEKDKALEDIKQLLPEGFTMEVLANEPTQFTPKDHPYITSLHQLVNTVTKQEHNVVKNYYVDDIRYYNELGISGVSFGPIGNDAHADDEFVDIQSINDYYQVLKKFLLSINPVEK